jgi:hypothetical protein
MKTKEPQTRVSRITIGRLYNLGNYEHVRYELTVEIPEGRSASLALRNVMRVLKAANPKPPFPSYDYEGALKRIEEPEAWHKNIANPKERKKAIREMVKSARETVKTYDTWKARRAAAEKLLDGIGCQKVFKDAKLSWGDNDDDWS